MGERKTKEQIKRLQKKYNVDRLWSWSRYNSYKTDPYGFMLHYIKHEPETRQNIYGVSGGICHDILEQFYLGETTYENMVNMYEDRLFEMNVADLKYDRNDEEKNKKIAKKYETCMRLFFQEHVPVTANVKTEQFVIIKVGEYVFQGYIDFVHKEEDNYIVTDFKTSTIYSGAKILKEGGQLILYAESLIQKGVPLENILCRWNFLKYCTVQMTLKGKVKEKGLHKTKTTKSLRQEWVSDISTNMKMWLKEAGYEELEIEDIVQTAIENNTLENLPEHIKNKYSVDDCYVYVPITQEVIDELKSDIINTLDEIVEKEKEYAKTKDDSLFWTEIDKSKEYYFYALCGYNRSQHKPFDEYLKDIEMFMNNTKKVAEEDSEDMDWLTDL